MTIQKTRNESVLTVALSGRLDAVTAPELEAELKDALEGVTRLILDIGELAYISSAGLRVLLSAQKRMSRQGSMEVRHASRAVMEVFEVTGFTDILTIRG